MSYPQTPADLTSLASWGEARQMIATGAYGVLSALTDYSGLSFAPYSGTYGPTLGVDDQGPFLWFDGGATLVNTSLAIAPATAMALAVVDQEDIYYNSVSARAVIGLRDSSASFAGIGIISTSGTSYQAYWDGAGGLQGYPVDPNVYNPMDQHLVTMRNASSNSYLGVNGGQGYAISNTYSTTSAGLLIGCLPSNGAGYQYFGKMRAWIVLNNPSAADANFARNYLMTQFPAAPFSRELPLLIINGNSIAQGEQSSLQNSTWWANAFAGASSVCDLRIAAKGGQTTPYLTEFLDRDVYPLLDKRRPRIVYLCWEAINDINGGSTAAQAWANTLAHYQDVQAIAPNAKMIVPTIMPSSEVTDTVRQAYNALARANYTTIPNSTLWDIGNDPNVGQNGQNVAPNFASNGTHLLDPGAVIVGASFARVLRPLISSAGPGFGVVIGPIGVNV